MHFLGFISPPILLFALPALGLGAVAAWRHRDELGGFAAAWFLGTWLPFAALSLFWLRTSYLYYMVDRDAGHLPRGRATLHTPADAADGDRRCSCCWCSRPPC